MKHGSLFSGIGGFDLAAEWMGWENVFHCELTEFNRTILNYYWPNAKSYKDITKTDFSIWRGRIDILTGGFPCQPYSQAGKRLGKEDERHLWPEMLRAIREIKPRFIVGENVSGLLTWNGGMVFDEVCSDLENQGYEVQAFIIPAVSKGAPHRRDRLWIVAYSTENRWIWERSEIKKKNREKRFGKIGELERGFERLGICWASSNTNKKRLERLTSKRIQTTKRRANEIQNAKFSRGSKQINGFKNFPTQSPICGRNDGIPPELDNITVSKWRRESLMAYGNAVVPQVVFEIFKAIENYEQRNINPK